MSKTITCVKCKKEHSPQKQVCDCGSTEFKLEDGSTVDKSKREKKTSSTKTPKNSLRKPDVEKIVRLVVEVQGSEEVSEPEKKKPTVEDYRNSTTIKEKKELDDLCAEWDKWESLSSNDPEKKRLVKIIQSVLNPSEEE